MPAKTPIRLVVANRSNFFLPVSALHVLALIATVSSPLPASSIAAVVAIVVVVGFLHILDFSKSNNTVELTSVIFPDGKMQLESGQGRIFVGVLSGRQWCTRHVAVLRIIDRERTSHLVFLQDRRQDADEFRRLRVWLRQDLCSGASAMLR